MKNNRLFAGTGLLLIIIIISAAVWFIAKPTPLIVQGEVEATQIKVASKVPGRIDSLYVKEGQKVHKGQLLVKLESPVIQAKLRQAKAARNAARAQKSKAYSGTRKETIRSAWNVWQKARAAAKLAGKTYERVSRLHSDGVVPAQKLDEAEAQKEAATQTEKAARAVYDMAKAGARDEDKLSAMALVDKASGAVSEVIAYMNETMLTAPIRGEISSVIAERGELIGAGYPVVSIIDLEDIWVTFNLREDMLADVKMGDVFLASFPALGNKSVKLKVYYITALGSFATWHATKTSGDFDMKTFEIRAVPVEKIEGLRPGMTAVVDWSSLEKLTKEDSSKKKQVN